MKLEPCIFNVLRCETNLSLVTLFSPSTGLGTFSFSPNHSCFSIYVTQTFCLFKIITVKLKWSQLFNELSVCLLSSMPFGNGGISPYIGSRYIWLVSFMSQTLCLRDSPKYPPHRRLDMPQVWTWQWRAKSVPQPGNESTCLVHTLVTIVTELHRFLSSVTNWLTDSMW